jgi:hypothetical protein
VELTTQEKGAVKVTSTGWRFKLGITIIALMFMIWLLIPLMAAMDASAGTIATATGGIIIANKVLLLVAVSIMGKAGFQDLKRHMSKHMSSLAPSATVGPLRYRIGLVMFCVPIVSSILEPYFDTIWPGLRPNSWQLQLLGDAMLIASLFVLGANFWGKLRALFVRTATVVDAGDTQAQS